jgi:hypothetical protein
VARARERIATAGLRHAEAVVTDASVHPFTPDSFKIVAEGDPALINRQDVIELNPKTAALRGQIFVTAVTRSRPSNSVLESSPTTPQDYPQRSGFGR